jgi:flagellar assembly protein FliH
MAAATRTVLRGERTSTIDLHTFVAVDDLPRPNLDRPVETGDARVDAIRGAAWDEGVERGMAAGHHEGYESGRREGFETGRREGREAGMAEAHAAVEAAVAARVSAALAALDDAHAVLRQTDAVALADIERDVVDLAVGLAEAIVGHEVAAATDPGADALRRALQLAPSRGTAVARLAPADIERLAEVATIAPGRAVEIVPDPSIASGGCIVEVGSTQVDATVDGALDRARAVLLGEAGGSDS